jgi:hypothetical protein
MEYSSGGNRSRLAAGTCAQSHAGKQRAQHRGRRKHFPGSKGTEWDKSNQSHMLVFPGCSTASLHVDTAESSYSRPPAACSTW